jgi:hypothetical protein
MSESVLDKVTTVEMIDRDYLTQLLRVAGYNNARA